MRSALDQLEHKKISALKLTAPPLRKGQGQLGKGTEAKSHYSLSKYHVAAHSARREGMGGWLALFRSLGDATPRLGHSPQGLMTRREWTGHI